MKRVLVVDDEEDISELIETFLSLEFEAEIIKASNGKEALEVFEVHSSIDLVICDLFMPAMNGQELFERLKVRGNPPFVFSTGAEDLDKEFLEEFKHANDKNTVLPKPWSADSLISVVGKVLNEKLVA